MRVTTLLRHAFGAAALAFVSVAQSATPGVVQGPLGWYEDIRFHSPATADVPTRVGTPGWWLNEQDPYLSFQTSTQGVLTVDSWDFTANDGDGALAAVVQTLSPAYRGLGAGANGVVDSHETMHLMFNSTTAPRRVDLVGLELFFTSSLTSVDLYFGELPTTLHIGQATVTTMGDVTRAQWWFAQPYASDNGEFTLANGQGAYYLGSVQVAAVPEPESIALLLAGVAVVGAAALRRRRG